MEHDNVPPRLTDKEFEVMMREFDLAQDWMLDQIELGRTRSFDRCHAPRLANQGVNRGDCQFTVHAVAKCMRARRLDIIGGVSGRPFKLDHGRHVEIISHTDFASPIGPLTGFGTVSDDNPDTFTTSQ